MTVVAYFRKLKERSESDTFRVLVDQASRSFSPRITLSVEKGPNLI